MPYSYLHNLPDEEDDEQATAGIKAEIGPNLYLDEVYMNKMRNPKIQILSLTAMILVASVSERLAAEDMVHWRAVARLTGSADYQPGVALALADTTLASLSQQGTGENRVGVLEIFALQDGALVRQAVTTIGPLLPCAVTSTKNLVALSCGTDASARVWLWRHVPGADAPKWETSILNHLLPPGNEWLRPIAFADDRLVVGAPASEPGGGAIFSIATDTLQLTGSYREHDESTHRFDPKFGWTLAGIDGDLVIGSSNGIYGVNDVVSHEPRLSPVRFTGDIVPDRLIVGAADPFFSIASNGKVEVWLREGNRHGPIRPQGTLPPPSLDPREIHQGPSAAALGRDLIAISSGRVFRFTEESGTWNDTKTGTWKAHQVALPNEMVPTAVAATERLVAVAMTEGLSPNDRRDVLLLSPD